jgi:hypothetical protein
MTVKSVSALCLILGGLALIAFETSIYGASPMAATRRDTASARHFVISDSKPFAPRGAKER